LFIIEAYYSSEDNFDEQNQSTRPRKSEFETEVKEKEAVILELKTKRYSTMLISLNKQRTTEQFAHVASHDLREPLRMITSYITILQNQLGNSLTIQQNEFMVLRWTGKAHEH